MGAYQKTDVPFLLFFFFLPDRGVENCPGLQTAVVLPRERTGIWEEASRASESRERDDEAICAFAARDFQTALDVIPGSQEKEKTRVRGTSPRGFGGFTLMAPRHIYNPSVQRRDGGGFLFNFPVVPFHCLAAGAAMIFNTRMFMVL